MLSSELNLFFSGITYLYLIRIDGGDSDVDNINNENEPWLRGGYNVTETKSDGKIVEEE